MILSDHSAWAELLYTIVIKKDLLKLAGLFFAYDFNELKLIKT